MSEQDRKEAKYWREWGSKPLSKEEHQFMSYSIPQMQWKVDKHRRDKCVGAISPVKASRYYIELSKVGAGWNGSNSARSTS